MADTETSQAIVNNAVTLQPVAAETFVGDNGQYKEDSNLKNNEEGNPNMSYYGAYDGGSSDDCAWLFCCFHSCRDDNYNINADGTGNGCCDCGNGDCCACQCGGADCAHCDVGHCHCDCGNIDCGHCDCGNLDCGNCDCGNLDSGNCDCGGCDLGGCDLGGCTF